MIRTAAVLALLLAGCSFLPDAEVLLPRAVLDTRVHVSIVGDPG